MAVIKLGAAISDIRGSIGGTTFARNRSGLFARARVKPVDDRTPRRNAVRNAVAALQNSWRATLTAVQRAGWDNLGDVAGGSNALGDKIRLTGINCYLRTNVILLLADESSIDDAPPIPYEIAMPVLVFASAVTAGVTLESITPALEVGDVLQVQLSAVYSPTRNFHKGPWPIVAWLNSTDTPPVTLSTGQPYVIGDRHFIAARLVAADGRVSAINRFQTDCVADV